MALNTEEGVEKQVIHVVKAGSDEVWATNKKALSEVNFADCPDWVEASYLISRIIYAFLPGNIPEPIAMEKLVEDAPEGMRRNVLRRSAYKRGEIPTRESNFSSDFRMLTRSLGEMGIDPEALDDWISNFIYDPDSRQLVYLDSVDPVIAKKDGEEKFSFHSVISDFAKLRTKVIAASWPEGKKGELLGMISRCEKLEEALLKKSMHK